jgi:hypothetical protein
MRQHAPTNGRPDWLISTHDNHSAEFQQHS